MKVLRKLFPILLIVFVMTAFTVSTVAAANPQPAPVPDEGTNIWQEFGTTLLQGTLEYVLPLLATFLTGLVITACKRLWDEIKARAGTQLQMAMQTAASIAVSAAEQLGLNDDLLDKKEEALEIAQTYLNAHGFKNVDLAVLGDLIEAAVYDQINAMKIATD
jgi:hypothetical protein